MTNRKRRKICANDGLDLVFVVTDSMSLRFLEARLDALHSRGLVIGLVANFANDEDFRLVLARRFDVLDWPASRGYQFGKDACALARLVWFLLRRRPWLVEAATPKGALLGLLAAWVTRVPHRVYYQWGLRHETLAGISRRVYQRLEKLMLALATEVLAVSKSVERALAQLGVHKRSKVATIGHGGTSGVHLATFRPPTRAEKNAARATLGVPPEAYVMIVLGRVALDKGFLDALEVHRSLAECESDHDFALLLCGPVEDARVAAQCAAAARCPEVTFLPQFVGAPLVMKAADVLLFPSYREGLPNVVLQAQAMGVPVAGYGATGTLDAVPCEIRQTLVCVGDVAALTKRVLELANNPDYSLQLAAHGREWVKRHFDSRRVVARHLDWYQGLARRTNASPEMLRRSHDR